MKASIKQADGSWELHGDILMENANQVLDQSKQLTLTGNNVVDLRQVTDLDTSVVSLMLEWERRAIKEGKQLTFVNLPDNLKSLIDLYGVEAFVN